jgi:hypothetical protein
MRETKANGWTVPNWSGVPMRALRLAAVALGIGMVMAAGAARAQEDDDEDKTFEEKIIEGIMSGIGGTNMDNRGIDYRERSPLVVPPKIDLPPPVTASREVKISNWPKDPDETRRKAAIEARKKSKPATPYEAAKPMTPSELNAGRTAAAASGTETDSLTPGITSTNPMLSPSQLGYTGGLFKIFHGNSEETAPFSGEPTRDSLTQPPTGYQTPSPNFPYGTGGPVESLNKPNSPAAAATTTTTTKPGE